MSRDIRIYVRLIDRATPVLLQVFWRLWWYEWGTNGHARRRALVAPR